MAEVWKSAAEWAAEKLPGLPTTKVGILERASRDDWPSRKREKPGGGKEYPASALPAKARDALAKTLVPVAPANHPVPVAAAALIPDPRFVKDWQKRAVDGRATILAEIKRLQMEHGVSQAEAINAVVTLSKEGKLPSWLVAAARAGNLRQGDSGTRLLSRTTIYKWIKAQNDGGSVLALTPATAVREMEYPWADAFMHLWCKPDNPALSDCLEDLPALLPPGVDLPSYDQLRRFLKKLSPFEKNKGRVGPRAMKKFKANRVRTVDGLMPGDIYVGDGHTFKALWAHPDHGRPFRPEVTSMIDVRTRFVPGWSAALSENTWSVADALQQACKVSRPLFLYYDKGAGANNAIWDAPVTGMMGRLDIDKMNSIPGNSQARGVIERLHSTVMHKAAKKLPSYVGQDMDREARFYQHRKLTKDIRETGTSDILGSWPEFIAFMDETVKKYNNRPHSFLPKIQDPVTGKMRHQTPQECWDGFVEAGWQPDPISDEEARYLFRPYEIRTVQRATVRLYKQSYFSLALEPYHGQEVQVGYDIHDGSKVYVNDSEGCFICEAIFEANHTSYIPKSELERKRESRVDGQVKRLRKHEAIAEEGRSPRFIDHAPAMEIAPEYMAAAMAQIEGFDNVAVLPVSDARPKSFSDDGKMTRWLVDHPEQITDADRKYLRPKVNDFYFSMMLESHGIDVEYFKNLILKRGVA